MKKYVIAFAICGSLYGAKKPDIVTTINPPDTARTISFGEKDIPSIHTKVGYTTALILPKAEVVMEVDLGDTDSWDVRGAKGTNFVNVKPSKAGAHTNMNVTTASGNSYSFLLMEGDGQRDLKVFIQPKDAEMTAAMDAPPKWVLASEMASKLETAQRETVAARGESSAAKEEVQRVTSELATKSASEIAAFRSSFPSSLRHDYAYKNGRRENKVFAVQAMAHSEKFTYIWANPSETPALYEVKDGKPSLIQFRYKDGLFTADKVIDEGYLAVGKAKMSFKRED